MWVALPPDLIVEGERLLAVSSPGEVLAGNFDGTDILCFDLTLDGFDVWNNFAIGEDDRGTVVSLDLADA